MSLAAPVGQHVSEFGGGQPKAIRPIVVARETTSDTTWLGVVCPCCGSMVAAGNMAVLCPHCLTPNHVECWRAHGNACGACGTEADVTDATEDEGESPAQTPAPGTSDMALVAPTSLAPTGPTPSVDTRGPPLGGRLRSLLQRPARTARGDLRNPRGGVESGKPAKWQVIPPYLAESDPQPATERTTNPGTTIAGSDVVLFSGTANRGLAEAVARDLGMPLGKCSVERFPDGEVAVRLGEPVRRKAVFIVQSTSPPVNEHLVELLAFADACRRASAERITAVMPYFGYSRADARHGNAQPISARMVADVLQAVGIHHVITVDPHAAQLEGFFHVPVDCLTAVPTLCAALRDVLPPGAVVVSPDAGRVRMATEYAHRLGIPGARVVVLHKRRETSTVTEVTHIVGDVRDRPCLIIDDMISTGGTIGESVDALLEAGARPEILVAATHGLFVRDAREKLTREELREVLVTDTVAMAAPVRPVYGTDESPATPIRVVSIAAPIAAAIRQLTAGGEGAGNPSEQIA